MTLSLGCKLGGTFVIFKGKILGFVRAQGLINQDFFGGILHLRVFGIHILLVLIPSNVFNIETPGLLQQQYIHSTT